MKKALAPIMLVLPLALTACNSGSNTGKSTTEAASGTQAQAAHRDINLSGQVAKRSYALGMDIGSSVSDLPVDLNVAALLAGVHDVVTGAKTQLSPQEKQIALKNLFKHIKSARVEKAEQLAQANLEASKAFLAENKTKPGVHVTDSGLQYKVLHKGDGPVPDLNDTVTVQYTGKLIDGTVFDSTRKRGEPVTFPVDAVIQGWTEALQMMHEGARYKLFIPPRLAYGKQGAGALIGPNQVLIFEVKLVSVNQRKEGDSS